MSPKSLVELADRKSRLRATLFAAATLCFLAVQILTHPPFAGDAYTHGWRMYAWAFNVALLLLCLGGGGGYMNSRALRALIQDEVARRNNRTACTVGFWIAAVASLALYTIPKFQAFTGQQVAWIVVTLSSSAALLSFSWLELRAHSDA
jgi:protein-S-isoprenylcysteine O-methyltransferase Ste14